MALKGCILLFLLWISPVLAIGVSPTRIVFDGPQSSSREITITGDRISPLAVEISLAQRSTKSNRNTENKKHCVSLSLPQAYIAPKKSVTILVKYKKDKPECENGSFYVIIETLIIESNPKTFKNQVIFSSRLLVPLHINPGSSDGLKASYEKGGTLSITNVSEGSVLYNIFDVQLDTGSEWVEITGQRLATHFQSDALLSGESITLDPSVFLTGEDYQGVRIRPKPQSPARGS